MTSPHNRKEKLAAISRRAERRGSKVRLRVDLSTGAQGDDLEFTRGYIEFLYEDESIEEEYDWQEFVSAQQKARAM